MCTRWRYQHQAPALAVFKARTSVQQSLVMSRRTAVLGLPLSAWRAVPGLLGPVITCTWRMHCTAADLLDLGMLGAPSGSRKASTTSLTSGMCIN
jgi:hypothetical protein